MPNAENTTYLSENVKRIKQTDEQLKNIIFEQPSFEQPSDKNSKAEDNLKYTNNYLKNNNIFSEDYSIESIKGNVLNFLINGVPILI
jgi:hypothetical protein